MFQLYHYIYFLDDLKACH